MLKCIECGQRDERGLGWRAYIDAEHDVWIYCAACSDREFGGDAEICP